MCSRPRRESARLDGRATRGADRGGGAALAHHLFHVRLQEKTLSPRERSQPRLDLGMEFQLDGHAPKLGATARPVKGVRRCRRTAQGPATTNNDETTPACGESITALSPSCSFEIDASGMPKAMPHPVDCRLRLFERKVSHERFRHAILGMPADEQDVRIDRPKACDLDPHWTADFAPDRLLSRGFDVDHLHRRERRRGSRRSPPCADTPRRRRRSAPSRPAPGDTTRPRTDRQTARRCRAAPRQLSAHERMARWQSNSSIGSSGTR